jgi:hypothetical protein
MRSREEYENIIKAYEGDAVYASQRLCCELARELLSLLPAAAPPELPKKEVKSLITSLTCRFCEYRGKVWVQTITTDDGAHDDNKYTCEACGRSWWIDGIDA